MCMLNLIDQKTFPHKTMYPTMSKAGFLKFFTWRETVALQSFLKRNENKSEILVPLE